MERTHKFIETMTIQKTLLSGLSGLLLLSSGAFAQFNWSRHYEVTQIDPPEGADYQIGGLDYAKNGDLIACFHRGEVRTYNEGSKQWKLFASGLHEPLGIYVEENGDVLVIQRGELTRLHDEDGDGVADFYENVCNDWGLSGNYHEFTFGVVKDSKKNIYISLGTASNMAGVRENVRGEWNNTGGLSHDKFLPKDGNEWKVMREEIPRMYARVPYRGCVLKISPDSKKAEVYATGVRTPNGLYVDENDQLWVSDNQGDWVGASKVHKIKQGGFHGHVASLLWAEDPPKVTPAKLPIEELEARRIKAPILLPQGDCGNSITQPLGVKSSFIPHSEDANAEGHLLVGEMNHPRLIRYMPDTVNGFQQGTATHLLDTNKIESGNNRLLYSKDGKSLYVGKTHLSWPGREGIRKITYTGKPFLFVENVKLTEKGFEFSFNADISTEKSAEDVVVDSYRIAYHSGYGSKKYEQKEMPCSVFKVDGDTLTIEFSEPMIKDRVYDIIIPRQIGSKIGNLSYNRFWYTAHEVH